MRSKSLLLAVPLCLGAGGTSACLSFSDVLGSCQDGGRCPDLLLPSDGGATGGGGPTSGGGGGAAGGAAGGGAGGAPAGGGTGGGSTALPGASAQTSSVAATPGTVAADGVAVALVTVTVRNPQSQPLDGQVVKVAFSGDGAVAPLLRQTRPDGTATFTVTATHPTTGNLTATVDPDGTPVVLASHPSVAFVAGHRLGGRVTNLNGTGLVLSTAGTPDLPLDPGATAFTFAGGIAVDASYAVAVKAQPSGQRCAVDGGVGTMGSVDVTSVEVGCVSTWSTVAAGRYHVLGVKTDGTLWTWGENSYGQLGRTWGPENLPQVVEGASFVAVAGGGEHSMAIDADGGLWAWGGNESGQLGLGFFGNGPEAPSPVTLAPGVRVRAVALGFVDSLFLDQNGQAWSTGYNTTGQLGNGTAPWGRELPSAFWSGFSALSAGALHNLGLDPDGGLFGWGFNASGSTGTGPGDGGVAVVEPMQVPGAFIEVSAAGYYSLGLKADGSLWAWGDDSSGQFGDQGDAGTRFLPTQVGRGYAHVAAGLSFGFGLKADGTLWAWGACDVGQLGTGCDGGILGPSPVGADFASVVAGETSAVGLKKDGTLWAWGSNAFGQLGRGVDGGLSAIPVMVP